MKKKINVLDLALQHIIATTESMQNIYLGQPNIKNHFYNPELSNLKNIICPQVVQLSRDPLHFQEIATIHKKISITASFKLTT